MKYGKWQTSWLIFALGFWVLMGLLAARAGFSLTLTMWLLVFALLPLLLKSKFTAIIFIAWLGFTLGIWRGSHFMAELDFYKQHIGSTIEISGRIDDDPVYSYRGQLEFHVTNPVIEGSARSGRVQVRALIPDAKRGDWIIASGKLRKGYGNRQGSIQYAKIQILGRDNSWPAQFRAKFIASIYSNVAEPQASLGLGFLIGVRSLLPENLLDDLSRTGLTHIVAVSGYNLTILVQFARRAFGKRSRFQALLFSFTLLGGFLLMTGFSPSIVRASVVSVLSLLTWYFGRSFKPIKLLMVSAAVTAYANPFYLWFDLGWHLSFLAFFGVLVLAPLIHVKIFKDRKPKVIGQLIIETSSAQIMTLPLIVYIFGQLSVISLLANIIILPLVPLAMLLTFVTGMAGVLFGSFAAWIAWPTEIILSFVTNSISLMARAPWALSEVNITKNQFILSFVLLAIIWISLAKFARNYAGAGEIQIYDET